MYSDYFDPVLGLVKTIPDWGSTKYVSDQGREWRAELVLYWLTIYVGPGAWWKEGGILSVTKIKAWILEGEAGEVWLIVDKASGKLINQPDEYQDNPNPLELKAEFINHFLGDGLDPKKLSNYTFFFNPKIKPEYPEAAEFNIKDWNLFLDPPEEIAINYINSSHRPVRANRWWREGEPGTEDRTPKWTYILPVENNKEYYFDLK